MLSDMYEAAKVRERCLEIIARNFEAFAEATEFRALLLTLQPDAQDDFVSELRERWLAAAAATRHRRNQKSAAARLDRRNKSAALFDQRLEMLLLAIEAARGK
jgi:ankyrin repeat/BTB/POZ domain-containing protein 1